MSIVNGFLTLLNWIFNSGAALIVPISVLLIGLVFRAPFKRNFTGALKLAVGFTATDALLGVIFGAMDPAAYALSTRFGFDFPITDVGWPIGIPIVWGVPWSVLVIAILIVANGVLVSLGVVKTLNVDVHNMVVFVFYGACVYYVTGSWLWTVLIITITWFISLKLADWIHPFLSPYYKMSFDSITISHPYAIQWAPIGFVMDKIYDKIPGIKNIKLDADTIQNKFGVFGDTIFVGFAVGFLVGAIAFFDLPFTLDQLGQALSLGFTVAMFMYLVPRAAELLISGLQPLSMAIRDFVATRLKGREFYVGMDVALLIGSPEHTAIGVLTTPLAFLIAFLLPWNKMLPLGDVAGLFIFICVFITNTCRGNIFRGLLNSVLLISCSLLVGGALAPANMEIVAATNYVIPAGMTMISTMCWGTTPVFYAIYEIIIFIAVSHNVADLIIAIAILVIFFGSWYLMKNRPQEYAKELLEADE